MVDGKRVGVLLHEIQRGEDLAWVRSACQLVEVKVREVNPKLDPEQLGEMWTYDDRFNAVLTLLLNRSTPNCHLLVEFAVALRKRLKRLEEHQLAMAGAGIVVRLGGAR
jgi:hypothetical protein